VQGSKRDGKINWLHGVLSMEMFPVVQSGSSLKMDITITNDDDTPYDLTDLQSAVASLKTNIRDEDEDALALWTLGVEINFSEDDPATGILELRVTPEAMALIPVVGEQSYYWFDMRIRTKDGDVYSVADGILPVRFPVTQTVPVVVPEP
jgi:hypothetical protein